MLQSMYQASHMGLEPWLSLFLTTTLYCISRVHNDVPEALDAQ